MPRSPIILTALLLLARLHPAQGDNRLEAMVNGKAITHFDVMARLKKDKIPYGDLPESEKARVVLDVSLKMAEEILREQAVAKCGIQIDEEDFRNAKEKEIQLKGGRPEFERFLAEQGQTEELFDAELRRREEGNAWLLVVTGRGGARLNRNLRPLWDVSVTAAELRRFYDENLIKHFTIQDQVDLRVIQLYFTAGPRGNKTQKREQLEEVKFKLKTEADLGVLAERMSDHTSKAKQGLMNDLRRSEGDLLPAPVEEAVFAETAQEGDVIGPIEHVNSFWLVRIERKLRARVVPFAEAQQRIEVEIRRRKIMKAINIVLQELVRDAYVSPPKFKGHLEESLRMR